MPGTPPEDPVTYLRVTECDKPRGGKTFRCRRRHEWVQPPGSSQMITFVLALIALIIAIMSGTGKSPVPLWFAIALLAIAVMIPWMVSMSLH